MSNTIPVQMARLHRGEAHYNGTIGTCSKCRQPRQRVEGGVCRACAQHAKRDKPARRRARRACVCCGGEARAGSSYCATCASVRYRRRQDDYNERRKEARRGKR